MFVSKPCVTTECNTDCFYFFISLFFTSMLCLLIFRHWRFFLSSLCQHTFSIICVLILSLSQYTTAVFSSSPPPLPSFSLPFTLLLSLYSVEWRGFGVGLAASSPVWVRTTGKYRDETDASRSLSSLSADWRYLFLSSWQRGEKINTGVVIFGE